MHVNKASKNGNSLALSAWNAQMFWLWIVLPQLNVLLILAQLGRFDQFVLAILLGGFVGGTAHG